MIRHLDKEQTKIERRRLLGDTIYVIFHDTLKAWHKDEITTLSPVELFLAAKSFSKVLIELPEVMEGIDDEMDDLENEAECENDAMIIMMLASAIIHAVGTHRLRFESSQVIMAIYVRWREHELFNRFLDEGAKKEQSRWLEGKKTNLLIYELMEIDNNGEGEEAVRQIIKILFTSGYSLSKDTIKEIILSINKYSIEHGNIFANVILDLYKEFVNLNTISTNDNNGIIAGGNFEAKFNLTNEQASIIADRIAAGGNKNLIE